MSKILTIQDTIDCGFEYGYQEYGGACTAYGRHSKLTNVSINFDENYLTEFPFVEIHKLEHITLPKGCYGNGKNEWDEYTYGFKGMIATKEDFIRVLKQLDIKYDS